MNLNGTIKKTQALSGRLLKSSGGGGSVQEIYWVHYGVGTATNAEVNEAVAANKLPICYWDSTDAYGRPRRTLYFLIRNTPTESFFSGVDYINNTIIVRRLYADAWDTQTIRYEGKLTWDTTPRFGSANPVTSGGIYNAIQNATVSDEKIAEAVDDWLSVQAPSIGTLSYAAKQALLACFRKVAWIDDQGQSYYNALESELFPDATLESITAVFTQGSAVIYDTDSLDTLRQYLVVTATFSDSTTATVTDYTLSGTLTEGTSTITVGYGGKTATFDVTVTQAPTMYTILNNLTDVVNSNSATSIAENAQYSATLTPSANYRLSTVNVTMDGVDITSSVYSNGVITIAAVTGNIVITAVAVEDVPASGPDAWYDGVNYAFREGTTPNTYIVSNTGVETVYNGWSSSDYMNCAGASSLTYSTHTPYGAWYDANKNYISGCSLTREGTISVATITVPSNAVYFRTSWADVGTSSPYVIKDWWYITPNA